MLTKLIGLIIKRRHFWRHATFSEIAELYVARLLRQTANSLFATFAAIYLYRSGYSLLDIAMIYASYSFFRVIISLPLAKLVAYYGPKHSMLWANLIKIPSLLIFSLLGTIGAWAVFGHFVLQGISLVLYDIAHKVNFSKVKNSQHAGREIGVMNVMDKMAAGVSPVVGGLIAWFGSPEWILWIASLLLLCAALPLLLSSEQITLKQKISFKKFPLKSASSPLIAQIGYGIDMSATAVIWPLFLAIIAFASAGEHQNVIYAQVGALASITLVFGLIVSRIYGRVIDKNKGGELFKYTTNANAIVHILRAMTTTPTGAIMINILNELAAVGQNMALMRGNFDMADRLGYRISYFAACEAMFYLGSTIIYLLTGLSILIFGESNGLVATFIIVAPLSLVVRSAKFPLYR